MYCLFLKFEDGGCLPREREAEVQESPGVGAVQKLTKQCGSHDKVVRAEVLRLPQRRVRGSQARSSDGMLLDNDRRAFVAPIGCK